MPTITFIEHNGTTHSLDAENGDSLMDLAVFNGVPGIDGDCGGSCGCGTCHVYVETPWLERLDAAGAEETAMLGSRPERAENSRLACQIRVSPVLDGLTVRIPAFQY